MRTALEIAVTRVLDAAMSGFTRFKISTRAEMLFLRCHTETEIARRANAVWSHLCLGCHYHLRGGSHLRPGPPLAQEVGELVQALNSAFRSVMTWRFQPR